MDIHQRDEALDAAFDRYKSQLDQITDDHTRGIMTLKDYDIRFGEIRDHYNNAIESINDIYTQSKAA